MHTTANGVTSDSTSADGTLVKVTDYHPASIDTPQARLDSLLRRAERLVVQAAPTQASTAYRAAAKDTELAVFEYLHERPAYADTESAGGISVTYAKDTALWGIIRDGMGSYVSTGRGLRAHPLKRG